MAIDPPHYQHHPHLQSYWQKNLSLEAVILKTVSKVGMARRPPCPLKRNISPRRCPNPQRFLVFDSETADEPVFVREISRSTDENCSANTGWNSKGSTVISRNFYKAVGENAPSPYLTTVTQLRVTKIT
jgi:hypothetical protein